MPSTGLIIVERIRRTSFNASAPISSNNLKSKGKKCLSADRSIFDTEIDTYWNSTQYGHFTVITYGEAQRDTESELQKMCHYFFNSCRFSEMSQTLSSDNLIIEHFWAVN